MRWITATRPHVDRCSTAWLLRRFVDPAATFEFLAQGGEVPAGATPYDLPGVKHGHHGNACTFETVVEQYGLMRDAGLLGLAALVHGLDFHERKRPESAGLDAILTGILLSEPDDARVLEKASVVFEALYARETSRARR